MIWSKFTEKYISLFEKKKKKINSPNNLIELLKLEKNKIIIFMKKNYDLNISINKINTDDITINNNINSYSDIFFVNTNIVLSENKKFNNNYIIKWTTINNSDITNIIIIKSYSCKNILLRMKILILFIEYLKYKTNNINKKICIYLLLTTFKKYFPSDNIIIDVDHVNSGYTDINKQIIFIWRLEEFEKVLFHELIHLFNVDCRNNNIDLNFNIDGPTNYYESITDFWGILYNLIYISIIIKKKIKILFEIEFAFIQNQAITLYNYYNLNSISNNIIKQNTAAFTYYILKYNLFNYIINNNKKINNNILLKYINSINKSSQIINNNNNEYIKIKSSRMTLLELKY